MAANEPTTPTIPRRIAYGRAQLDADALLALQRARSGDAFAPYMDREFLRYHEAAAIFGVSKETIRNWARPERGLLRRVQVGRLAWVHRTDLEALIELGTR